MPGRNRRRRKNKNGGGQQQQQEERAPARVEQPEAVQPKQPPPREKPKDEKRRVIYPTFSVPKGTPAVSPVKRLMRDLAELQREELLTVSACPLEDNIFEWHVNIKAPDGVYAGSYLHCVMTFPQTYPKMPPEVRCETPIAHPNLFMGGFICLSMLTQWGSNREDNFEGWSSAYSVTSILFQLQSFFFADRIRQGHGGFEDYADAQSIGYRDNSRVKESITRCKQFKCSTCGHSHQKPYPPVAIDNIEQTLTMKGTTKGVSIDGTNVQTMVERWVGAYAEQCVTEGRAMYEVLVQWTGDEWRQDNITGGLCRFGWGTSNSGNCGCRGDYSVGYGGTAKFSWDGNFTDFGETFTKGDVITCAVDFEDQVFLFAKNGRLLKPAKRIPGLLLDEPLYPLASFKNARAEFNFGHPNRPVPELEDFIPMGCLLEWERTLYEEPEENPFCGWYNLPDDCSLVILRFLDSVSLYCASWSMRRWAFVFRKYSLAARQEICCFHTKIPYSRCVLGFGMYAETEGRFTVYTSQMDYLSNFAWKSGVREAAWGSRMDLFMPLIINAKHARRSVPMLEKALAEVNKNRALALAKLMNDIVVKLARQATEASKPLTGASYECAQCGEDMLHIYDRCKGCGTEGWMNTPKRKVPVMEMNMSEKALIGYASFHHMLLYFVQNDPAVKKFAEGVVRKLLDKKLVKGQTRDLGQALVFLSCIPGMAWENIAKSFTEEGWTRKILWLTRENQAWNRPSKNNYKDMFKNTAVGRGVVMFQVLFASLVSSGGETPAQQLEAYNRRLGRPKQETVVRLHAFCREFVELTKNGSFTDNYNFYWNALGFKPLNPDTFVELLQYSVARSDRLEYHRANVTLTHPKGFKCDKVFKFNVHATERIEERRRRGIRVQLTNPNAVKLSGGSGRGWAAPRGGRGRGRGDGRGRGRGGGRGRGRGQNQRGRGRGAQPQTQNPPRATTAPTGKSNANEPAELPQRKKKRKKKKKNNNNS